jgi:hypothetical protein
MDTKEFQENLLVYGADLDQWPEEGRLRGMESLKNSSELQELLREQEEFEKLLKARRYEEPSGNFAERIIAATLLHQKEKTLSGFRSFFSRLLVEEFRLPKPVLAAVSISMVTVLLVGFVIGFLNPTGSLMTEQEQTSLQEFLYYEGDAL